MKPGTRDNIHQLIIFSSFHYLGQSTLKLLVGGSRVVEQPIVAPLVHLAIVFVEERDAFTLTSTVILGCAGIAGFSEAFGLASSELDLSPWRAAASSKCSWIREVPNFSHQREVCPQTPGRPHSLHYSDLPRQHWLRLFLPDICRMRRVTGVEPKPPVFWWVHSRWRSSPLLAQVVDAPDWYGWTLNRHALYSPAILAKSKWSSLILYRTPQSEVCFAQGEPLLSSPLFQNLRASFCQLIRSFFIDCQDFTSSEMQSKIGSGHLYKHAEIIHICAGQF